VRFVGCVCPYAAAAAPPTLSFQVYRLLGLTVGLVCAGLDDAARREAYGASVTYATNSELGFDYLRDNLALSLDQVGCER